MRYLLLHAREESSADAVAQAFGLAVSLRWAVGSADPGLRVGSVDAAVIWSADAARHGWPAFARLLSPATRLVFILTDDTPPPVGVRGASVRFGPALVDRVDAALSGGPVGGPAARNAGFSLRRVVAGALAMVGLMAPTLGAQALASPPADGLSHATSTRQPGVNAGALAAAEARVTIESPRLASLRPDPATAVAFDLDRLAAERRPAPSLEQAAEALARGMVLATPPAQALAAGRMAPVSTVAPPPIAPTLIG